MSRVVRNPTAPCRLPPRRPSMMPMPHAIPSRDAESHTPHFISIRATCHGPLRPIRLAVGLPAQRTLPHHATLVIAVHWDALWASPAPVAPVRK
eukprot:scaffold260955_cov30-Tisochrysis_lutea.AAC.2